ncbi:MAG: hypothetical protein HY735_17435 [Verrucomicrobia bacterium]|nr:hypothetical protein [Verrucomicrobiota bacterium]
MKATDHLLRRLFRAAARAPRREQDGPPSAMEARILAAWRSTLGSDEGDGVLRFLQIGLVFASALTLVIIALSLHNLAKQPANEVAMPNAVLNLALLD